MSAESGYGVVSVPSRADPSESAIDPGAGNPTERVPLTERLGCTEMGVDAYAIADSGAVDLDPGRERVVVTLDASESVALDGRFAIPHDGVVRVPPNRPCTVGTDGGAVVLVVSAPTTVTDGAEPTILDLEAVEYDLPSTSDVATAFLTTRLSCTGVKVNARTLEAGQAVPYHTEGTQEELFVPLDDAGTMRIDDERIATPRGTVVRVAPETPRSAVNDGDGGDRSRWLMFGVPPTGGPAEWDPGATIIE